MPLARLCCWAVLAAAAAAAVATDSAAKENVLEHFPTNSLRVAPHDSQVKISYNTTTLTRSGEWVEVSWSGVANPTNTDLLAVYSPPDAFTAGTAPIKFANASHDGNHLRSGSGKLALRLINVRADMRVVFVRGGDPPTLAARGPVISNTNQNEPTGIHLMRTRRSSELLVQFATKDSREPVVRWGKQPHALDYQAPARSATYGPRSMCGGTASGEGFIDPGLLHTASMTGLQPGHQYFYVVGDAASRHFSAVFSFRGPPEVGPGSTVQILALADQGVGEVDGSWQMMEYQPAAAVAALTVAEGLTGVPSLVLHAGDIAYARGYTALWDAFLFQQQELSARVPYMVCVGNHERDWLTSDTIAHRTIDSGGECGVPYEARFPMPTAGPDQPWYSFEHGPVHFTVMSSEHHFEEGTPQHAWLAADLASVDRTRTPWLVFVGHRPMYVDADDAAYGEEGKQTSAVQLQAVLEGMLDRHAVDIMIAGHHHSYQRTCRVYQQACQSSGSGRGIVHLCIGNAGAQPYNNPFPERPAWVAHEAQLTHGYSRLTVNATHFLVEAIDAGTGRVFDTTVVTKERSSHTERLKSLFGKRAEALVF